MKEGSRPAKDPGARPDQPAPKAAAPKAAAPKAAARPAADWDALLAKLPERPTVSWALDEVEWLSNGQDGFEKFADK